MNYFFSSENLVLLCIAHGLGLLLTAGYLWLFSGEGAGDAQCLTLDVLFILYFFLLLFLILR